MQEHKLEKKIGNTLFIVTSQCSPEATETVEQKLLRILNRHISDAEKLSESYQDGAEDRLLCDESSGNMLHNAY
jgi:hypothetical protein